MPLTISIEGKGVIANCDALTNDTGGTGTGDWGELGGGSISFNPDVYLYGAGSIASKYANKSGYTYFTIGETLNFGAAGTEENQLIYIWLNIQSTGQFDTLANEGFAFMVGTDTSNLRKWVIAGDSDGNGWSGGWKCFVIDPTSAGTSDVGTYNSSSVTVVGVWIDTDVAVRADSIFIDQIAVGKGLRITGTSTQGWRDVVDYCTDFTNRAWGMFEEREGVFYSKAGIYIGDTTQTANTDFADSGRVIKFETSEYWNGTAWVSAVPTTAFGVALEDNATYSTNFTDGVLVGSDNGRSGSSFIGNSNENIFMDLHAGSHASSASKLYGTTLKSLYGAINLGNTTNHKMFGCSVVDCSQFNPVGSPTIRNCVFSETADLDSALLWNENIDIQDCTFIANTVGAAIEMPSAVGSPYDYSALFFSGNTFDVLNSSGSAITVNKLSLSDPSTYEGSLVTFSANFSHTLEGLELNTEVTYVTADTSTELFHVENATTSDGSGKYKTTYSHTGGASVDILIHHINYQPDISNIYGLTLPSQDATVKVQMFPDDNYLNP